MRTGESECRWMLWPGCHQWVTWHKEKTRFLNLDRSGFKSCYVSCYYLNNLDKLFMYSETPFVFLTNQNGNKYAASTRLF